MTDSTVTTRRARSRAARPKRSRPAGLVVALMMALVFVPVLALHVVALTGATREADRPAELATATQKPPSAKKVPG
ncbi:MULTISPECIES: hypothetical protein [Methylorubrum]|uniref:Uncharacterized protein n=1 Tax=Methylorubrum suomiense TaxID=144191 RepID=A0ABQ4V1I8_9HYPH|nr:MULTISPECIES: hypothetical protein [Methylobacteriaceae]GJE78170.1 hypothetical protein BGCPKDLD_4781 [Methylorubrum suomiense]